MKISAKLISKLDKIWKLRLYIEKELVDSKEYNVTLETYFKKRGKIGTNVYIEVARIEEVWPLNHTESKKASNCKSLTNGLYNLGNSIVNDG